MHHLLPEQDKAVIYHFIVMIMSEQPAIKVCLVSEFFQKIGQVIVDKSSVAQCVFDAAGGAMGDDVVHVIVGLFQVALRFLILRRAWKFFFPPGVVVDPKVRSHSTKSPILFLKVWGIGIQNAIFDVVAAGSAHGEEGVPLQFKNLTTHQVDDMGADALDLSAVLFFYRVFCQKIKILVVSADK